MGVRSSWAISATRFRQLSQLAGRADLACPRGAVPGRHGPGHRDQPGDGPGDPPGHDETGEQGKQGSQPGCPGDGAEQRGLQDAVGGIEPGTGGTGHGRADTLAPDHDRGPRLQAFRGGEGERRGDGMACLVAYLDGRAGARG